MTDNEDYGHIRDMRREDIPAVMEMMEPFIKSKVLLPRTEADLLKNLKYYVVYELNGVIMASSSLLPYDDGQMEIAAITVDAAFAHMGLGKKIVDFLVARAKRLNAKGIFLLTIQPVEWFESLGFELSDLSTLPQKRRALWDPKRASKVLRYTKL